MGNVVINGRTAVHAGSGGVLTTPDVCKTPRRCRPQTYTNTAVSSDAAKTAGSVLINGHPACHKDAIFSTSTGDEPGSCGGVSSGTIKGIAEFVTWSPNVLIEGIPAVRQFDLMTSNNRNTPPMPLQQPGAAQPPELSPDGAAQLETTQKYKTPLTTKGIDFHLLKTKIVLDEEVTAGQSGSNSQPSISSSTVAATATSNNVSEPQVSTATSASTSKEEEQKLTRLKIYAEAIYGIKPGEFTMEKLKDAARKQLGIDDPAKLIPMEERKRNFEMFKEKHFSPYDEFEDPKIKPSEGMKAYDEIKKYALSDFGSILVKKIITETKSPKFHIGVAENDGVKAHGQYERNYIALPKDFPSAKYFSVSKQEIHGAAIIHHEFEHTKYGDYKNQDLNRKIKEEWRAVVYKENPVRIINNLEPRYVYYQNESDSTINIANKNETKTGKWTYDKKDPSKSMVRP